LIRCPKCGVWIQPDPKTHNLCVSCYSLSKQSTEPSTRKIKYCYICGAVRISGKWVRQGHLVDSIKTFLAIRGNDPSFDTGSSPNELKSGNFLKDQVIEKKKGMPTAKMLLDRAICTNCIIQKNKSYLFELKIRFVGRPMNEREIIYVMDLIEQTVFAMNDKNFVYEYSDDKDGVNVLFSTRKGAESVLKRLKNEFWGKEVHSSKLIGESHDRRRIYKTTFSFKILSFAKGTIFLLENNLAEIIEINKKTVTFKYMDASSTNQLTKFQMLELYRKDKIKVVVQKGSLFSQ
jgi:NMD protein affecting ribosome stability and mRNA decay